MANAIVRFAVDTVNGIGNRQGRTYSIERFTLTPGDAAGMQECGFDLLGDAMMSPSRGLHRMTPAQLEDFARFLIERATNAALYVDNTGTDYLYEHGHTYEYRSAWTPVSDEAVEFVRDQPNNSMRLLMRAFTKDALELPGGTVARMRDRVKGGARDSALFRELRVDPAIKTYQQSQWAAQAPVVGDVMLGHNSIIVSTSQRRFALDGERYIVDVITPATREFHILDGSSLWMRIVDSTARKLLFVVIGSGKHRHTLMDAFNNWGAMSIWHCMALAQEHLYDAVPSTYDEITAHIASARRQCGPAAEKLYRNLSMGDNDPGGSFMRGLRRRQAFEKGDGYI